jgi:hypothetical protein
MKAQNTEHKTADASQNRARELYENLQRQFAALRDREETIRVQRDKLVGVCNWIEEELGISLNRRDRQLAEMLDRALAEAEGK